MPDVAPDREPDEPVVLQDAAAPPQLGYASASTPRGPRRHSRFAFASCILLLVAWIVDALARKWLVPPGVSDSLLFSWEGEAEEFRRSYPAHLIALIIGAGIVCSVIALVMPRTKKWLAIIPLPFQALWLADLSRWL